MHFTRTISFALLSFSLATSALPSGAPNAWPEAILDSCRQSANCKVVNGEPVVDIAHTKRVLEGRANTGPNTTLVVPNQGTIDTSTCDPADMVNSGLYDHCQANGGCTTDSRQYSCDQPANTVSGKETTTCTVTQDGWYNGGAPYFYRNMFATTLQAAAKSFTQQVDHHILVSSGIGRRENWGSPNSPVEFKTNVVPSSIAATTTQNIGGTTVTVGWVRYTLSCQAPGQPTCSSILGAAGVVSGFLGMLAPEVIGPLFAAALGAVTPSCG